MSKITNDGLTRSDIGCSTGRAKKSNSLGKILYLWNCSRYIYQICSVHRWGFSSHILLILLK